MASATSRRQRECEDEFCSTMTTNPRYCSRTCAFRNASKTRPSWKISKQTQDQIDRGVKTCSKCQKELPVSNFYKLKSERRPYSASCKRCHGYLCVKGQWGLTEEEWDEFIGKYNGM